MFNGKLLIAFLGYVLPYGQMSLWGSPICPTWYYSDTLCMCLVPFSRPKTRANKRVGPHNF